jgi:hypothetical protein
MKAKPRFPADLLAILRDSKILRLRAGSGEHRFIGIWLVVVKDRVFIRSWSVKPEGWYRTFLKDPRGAIQVGDREMPVRAVFIKSQRTRDAIDAAYLAKYNTKGSLKYAKDLGQKNPELPPRNSCRLDSNLRTQLAGFTAARNVYLPRYEYKAVPSSRTSSQRTTRK